MRVVGLGLWLAVSAPVVAAEPAAVVSPAVSPTVAASERMAAAFRATPEGSEARRAAWSMVEAADDLHSASRDLAKSADWLGEASRASSNTAARPAYLNGHVELSTAAGQLGECARHLRAAVAVAAAAGLESVRARAAARLDEVEALRVRVQDAYDTLPSSDEVAASSKDVPSLLGPVIASVIRFDVKVAEIAGAF